MAHDGPVYHRPVEYPKYQDALNANSSNSLPRATAPAELAKQIMAIVTDDTPLEDPKDPESCNVFALMRFFTKPERLEEIRQKYLQGGYGYGHAKLELLDILLEYFGPAREKYQTYINNYTLVEQKLDE